MSVAVSLRWQQLLLIRMPMSIFADDAACCLLLSVNFRKFDDRVIEQEDGQVIRFHIKFHLKRMSGLNKIVAELCGNIVKCFDNGFSMDFYSLLLIRHNKTLVFIHVF